MRKPSQRTALVTGGATGIGAAITGRLASDDINVFVVQRTEVEARAGRELFHGHPAAERILVEAHDLATSQGCVDAVAACVSHFRALTILVNNAAIVGEAALGPIDSCDDTQIDGIIDTNLKAPLRLAREAYPYLTAAGGAIVNISSVAELQAQPEGPAYVASKAGLGGLTRALAYDLAPQGVRVVSLAPGSVETAGDHRQTIRKRKAHIAWGKKPPLGYPGQPEDIANGVAWVVSEQASYITGSTIPIDGGLSAY